MKLRIAYLHPNWMNDVNDRLPANFTEADRCKLVLEHEATVFFAPAAFIREFNMGGISDKGFVAEDYVPDKPIAVKSEPPDKVWTKGLPDKAGKYWFYGYRYGVISVGDAHKPELILLNVRELNGGSVMIVGDGQFVSSSEVEHAWYTPFDTLSLDPLPISPKQHKAHVKAAAN